VQEDYHQSVCAGAGGGGKPMLRYLIIAITPIDILYKITISCAFWAFGTVFIAFFLLPIIFSYFPAADRAGERRGFLPVAAWGWVFYLQEGKNSDPGDCFDCEHLGYFQQLKLR